MPRLMDSPLRHVLCLIAVVAVLGIAACGDDDDSSNGGGGSADTSAQQDTAP
jgi:hypothetical protein